MRSAFKLGGRRVLLFCALAMSIIGISSERMRAQQQTPPQVTWPPELMQNLAKLRDAALASDYAWQKTAHLTENIGPRLSGSPQAQQAVNYVADEMRRLGLDVKLEKVMVPHWVRGDERAVLTVFPGQAPGTTQKIVLAALGGSSATPADGIDAEVVVVDSFDDLAAMGHEKIAGKIVLFNNKFDKRMAEVGEGLEAYFNQTVYRGRGAAAAKAQGAVAALVRSLGNADFRLPHTGGSGAAGIPAAAVTAEDADLLADLTRQGRVVMHLVLTPQTLPDAESYNVIADLKGSEHPEQIVIVSGHLDSWDLGTGAIDDAAGIGIAMQTPNLILQLGLKPKRTVRFIAWMNEENGGRGGKAYAEEYKSELANHVGAVESDTGSDHPVGFEGTLKPATIDALQPVSKVLMPIGAGLWRDGGDPGADISPMKAAGVSLFGPFMDLRTYFNYHHTAADTLDKVNARTQAENAAAVAVLTYSLADMPEALPHQDVH